MIRRTHMSTTGASTFRYPQGGTWSKGNTHIHTTRSDGGLDVEQTIDRYASAEYDFIFLTDHWHASRESIDSPLLVLDGIELDGTDERGSAYHVVCLGRFDAINADVGLEGAMDSCRSQGGMMILAHPTWMANTMEDAFAHPFDGVEAYNHVCTWLNGKGHALHQWDLMLSRRPATLGFAVDDAHNRPEHPGWNGGWIMVRADSCSPESITESLRLGSFYSTQGPEIHEITVSGSDLQVRTSPIRFARLVGPGSAGDRLGDFAGSEMTGFRFSLDRSWSYIRLEIEDALGRRAWSNALFA